MRAGSSSKARPWNSWDRPGSAVPRRSCPKPSGTETSWSSRVSWTELMNAPDPNLLRPDGTFGSYRGKLVATCFSLGLVGAVLWPVQENWRAEPHDSFPLSYYPMFSAKRQAIETFYYMVGRDAEGKRYLIPHSMAGHGGLNAVRRQIAKICREGRGEELACTVAKRLAERERGR